MRTPAVPIILVLTMTACSTPLSRRWIGPLTPTGANNPTCSQSTAVAQIDNGHITFAPDQGTWILRGTITEEGRISAEHFRLGADRQPFSTTLKATLTGNTITGTYMTPRCSFTLKMAQP